MKRTIDIATSAEEGSLNGSIVLLIVFVADQALLNFISCRVRALLGIRMRNALQGNSLSKLLQSPWIDLRKMHTADIIGRMTKDVDGVATLFGEYLPLLLTTLFQLCGAFAFLYLLDGSLALTVIIIAPVFIFLSTLFLQRLRKMSRAIREGESHVLTCIQESLRLSVVVKTFDRISYISDGLAFQQHRLKATLMTHTNYNSISLLTVNVGFATGYLATFVWGVKHLQTGVISYGALTAFVQLVGQIHSPLRSLMRFVPLLVSATTSIERLMELDGCGRELEPTAYADSAMSSVSAAAAIPSATSVVLPTLPLTLHEVSFRYPEQEGWVISAFSHTFEPGSITAIQGATGSGKTTLVRLLLALLRPSVGMITLGADQLTVAAARSSIAYVPQGNSLFGVSIRDNLLFAAPTASETQMSEALRYAAADFVFTMPQGLDTICTECGGGMSEGQAQRLCIARALLHQAQIMIFDECTSALDVSTEHRVIRGILQACRGRTLIFVTHSPAVTAYCTTVIQLTS